MQHVLSTNYNIHRTYINYLYDSLRLIVVLRFDLAKQQTCRLLLALWIVNSCQRIRFALNSKTINNVSPSLNDRPESIHKGTAEYKEHLWSFSVWFSFEYSFLCMHDYYNGGDSEVNRADRVLISFGANVLRWLNRFGTYVRLRMGGEQCGRVIRVLFVLGFLSVQQLSVTGKRQAIATFAKRSHANFTNPFTCKRISTVFVKTVHINSTSERFHIGVSRRHWKLSATNCCKLREGMFECTTLTPTNFSIFCSVTLRRTTTLNRTELKF